jgi:hypothetical protein
MRRLIVGSFMLYLCGCGVTDYFSRKVVARVGDHVLTADWFAETMADGSMQLQPALLERWAWLWVQYSLYLQRLAGGDSLTDSVTVLETMWPEILTAKVARMHAQLIVEEVIVDSAVVDSAYEAGDYRIIDHILIRTGASLTASQQEQQRRKVDRIRAQLASGGRWDSAVEESEDPETKASGGRLGLIERGQTVPEFEQAAYGLEPGDLSDVVETYYGFHVLRRPTLTEVRVEYTDRITEVLANVWMDGMLAGMAERREIRITDDGPEIMRDAAARPLRILALEPGRVIGEYEGGSLTDVGCVHWLQVMPREEHLTIDGATDEELAEMARRAINNDLLKVEVVDRGIEITEEEFSDYKGRYERTLRELRNALGADSVMARATTDADRRRVAREVLDRYMVRTSQMQRDIEIVPPLLAAKLRAEGDWSFYYGGLNRAVRLAVELRAARDSTTP